MAVFLLLGPAADKNRNVAATCEVQHLAGHLGSGGCVAVRDRDPQRFEVLVGNDERERPGIINVVTDIGVEDHFHDPLLSIGDSRKPETVQEQ